ncbi:hypothetical protein [Sorangium sp. So ce590]|uniref:hypothetical protein n=1 Tax=unclassified Sorangium TaxID=2621164 RepID=UPI003F60ED53
MTMDISGSCCALDIDTSRATKAHVAANPQAGQGSFDGALEEIRKAAERASPVLDDLQSPTRAASAVVKSGSASGPEA